jgi:hypothetical protein
MLYVKSYMGLREPRFGFTLWQYSLFVWFYFPLILACAGCGGYSATANRVDPDIAKSTLVRVLDGWKEGVPCTKWQSEKPSITVQDLEWLNGAKLESYEILAGEEAIDANLYCQVKLRIKVNDQPIEEKTVKYIVSTKPVLTVFRSIDL